MANNVVAAEAARLLDASLGTASYTAPTGPMKARLMSTTGSATSAGTEVTGGSYASQTVVFGSATVASPAVATNTGALTYTGMPATTTNGIEVWDSNGTPRRQWTGGLTVAKATGAGDTLSFAVAAISASLG